MPLYLREAGPADAPALVFLHGLWLSSAMWQPQIERLSHDYHCLAPDLPEHGQSTDIGLLTLENTSSISRSVNPRFRSPISVSCSKMCAISNPTRFSILLMSS
jgi:pimeloyl-ACP methyl ester carboxylesterase